MVEAVAGVEAAAVWAVVAAAVEWAAGAEEVVAAAIGRALLASRNFPADVIE
jgi:hypothetical protein